MKISLAVFTVFNTYIPYTEVLSMDGVDNISAVLWICGGVFSGKCSSAETFSKTAVFGSTFVLIFSVISVL